MSLQANKVVDCPGCHARIRHDVAGGNWRIACAACGREWRIRYRCRWLYTLSVYTLALLVAYATRLEGPLFFGAFVLSALVIIFATQATILPLLPKRLEPLQDYIQTLGITGPNGHPVRLNADV